MAVGLPDVRTVAKNAMDKITGGYASADEMPSTEADLMAMLEEALERSEGDAGSSEVQSILAKMKEAGIDTEKALAKAMASQKGGSGAPRPVAGKAAPESARGRAQARKAESDSAASEVATQERARANTARPPAVPRPPPPRRP